MSSRAFMTGSTSIGVVPSPIVAISPVPAARGKSSS